MNLDWQTWGWLTDRDWKTWIGHAVQGALVVLIGTLLGFEQRTLVAVVAGVFTHRELDNGLTAFMHGELRGAKVIDGFVDWLAPVVAAIITSALI